jgi:hypothetical protein
VEIHAELMDGNGRRFAVAIEFEGHLLTPE